MLGEIVVDVEWPPPAESLAGWDQVVVAGSHASPASGTLWIAVASQSNGTNTRANVQGDYPLPWPARDNATVQDIVGPGGAAALLLRVDATGIGAQNGTGAGSGGFWAGGGDVQVWRARESTRVQLARGNPLALGQPSDSIVFETRPWQPHPSCGRVELRPSRGAAGRLRIAIALSLVEAS